MMTAASWSPYVVGLCIGLLSVLCLVLSGKTLGTSTSYARVGGMFERLFCGKGVLSQTYYQENPPRVDWQMMLVVGIVIGALISSHLSGKFHWQSVPAMWTAQFGPSALVRLAVAFLGGIVMGVGTRWAGGCTSGHGISGTMQLAVSSWIATICFFIGGVVIATLMYGVW